MQTNFKILQILKLVKKDYKTVIRTKLTFLYVLKQIRAISKESKSIKIEPNGSSRFEI